MPISITLPTAAIILLAVGTLGPLIIKSRVLSLLLASLFTVASYLCAIHIYETQATSETIIQEMIIYGALLASAAFFTFIFDLENLPFIVPMIILAVIVGVLVFLVHWLPILFFILSSLVAVWIIIFFITLKS